jgi:hypothetical protein
LLLFKGWFVGVVAVWVTLLSAVVLFPQLEERFVAHPFVSSRICNVEVLIVYKIVTGVVDFQEASKIRSTDVAA